MAFKYPNGPQDTEAILRYAEDIRRANQTYWEGVEAGAWEKILFYLGLQWIAYSLTLRFWRPMGLGEDIPRPVTNRVKPLVNDLASKLVAFKPPITWGPGSDQEADYVAASVADRVNTAIEKESDVRSLKPLVARWLALTGNVFLIQSYDTSPETGTRFIGAERCLGCGTVSMPAAIDEAGQVCPTCRSIGAPQFSVGPEGPMMLPQQTGFEPAIGPDGIPMGMNYPRGRHLTEIENIFTTRFDPQADRFHKSPYVKVVRTRDKAWVAEMYGDEIAEKVKYSRSAQQSWSLYDSLTFTGLAGGALLSPGGLSESDQVQVERIWIRPNPTKAPGGIYTEIVGEDVVKSGDYPYHDERGMGMLNIAHLEFDQVPGRSLASTRVDDVIPLQRDLNEIDAAIMLHSRRMANALFFVPKGAGMTRVSGEAGVMVMYDAIQGVPPPRREPGMPIPPHLIELREFKKKEMDDVFGLYEVGRGEAPRGVSAYAALQLLDERAQQGQSNLFDNWALGWMEVSRQHMNIFREYADEERVISLGVGRWATRKFSKAQMTGGVDMSIELGQNRPTTLVAKAARIGQAIQQGLLNVFDPQVRFLALRTLGIPDLMPDYQKDYEKAGRVIDQILSAMDPTQLPRPPEPFDNHVVHLTVLRQLEVDEAFEMLQPWQQQAILLRANIHFQFLRTDMLEQTAQGGQNAPRVGGPEGGGDGEGGESSNGNRKRGRYQTDRDVVMREAQGASPEELTGATVGPIAGQ